MLENLITAVLYILPAYVANASPVIGVKFVGKATPIDGGAKAWDGRRVLGDGKTIEGFLIGIISGTLVGLLLITLNNLGSHRSLLEPLILSIGAMLGDISGSFIKRRMGLKRGQPAPPLDQLGFVVCAMALCFVIYGAPQWLNPSVLTLLLVITFCLHLCTNYISFLLGLKSEPY
ncbi:MAG: CDP-2,3-bis-(O-geranylgeranyl)-sn-glycerol synthase [Thaumarchaeota archaeon]|nr:CDP-2,3-bis-(O-geranylgeranyl)-sn-glycerol synthase [Nitrososphaerota archaeon]